MAIAEILIFLQRASRDQSLKRSLCRLKSLEEVQDLARQHGFNFSSEEFFSVMKEIPDYDDISTGDCFRDDSLRQFDFCRDCGAKGSSFCVSSCYWGKI